MQDDDLARLLSFYNVFVRCEFPSCVQIPEKVSLSEIAFLVRSISL